ncbi:hypothetical protein BDP27DRAFT_1417219 [Rhodocollybia butyracea]|uniref:Uncharacterized protein n=1 Tax=Rhodocollybia butyracea TaxID=206335 RepID=A0A9P5PVS6_9AGAR|nr:hypothetical protein BDP27DRAFT_1417219 [Rhodocollybia butyracea]
MLLTNFLFAIFFLALRVVSSSATDLSSTPKSLPIPFGPQPTRAQTRRQHPVHPARSNRITIPQQVSPNLTNARRLAHGFPLKAPHRRRTHTGPYRATPSATPGSYSIQWGCIDIFSISTGVHLGCIAKSYNDNGAAVLTTIEELCLIVRLDHSIEGVIELITGNIPDKSVRYPFLGISSIAPVSVVDIQDADSSLVFTSVPHTSYPRTVPTTLRMRLDMIARQYKARLIFYKNTDAFRPVWDGDALCITNDENAFRQSGVAMVFNKR